MCAFEAYVECRSVWYVSMSKRRKRAVREGFRREEESPCESWDPGGYFGAYVIVY
jgi:hypothetical protein